MIINILKVMQNIEKLLNLEGIKINEIEIFDNEIIIKCSSIFKENICPKCGKKSSRVPKYYVRTIRDLKNFGKKTILKLTVRQFKCEDCHAYFNEKFTFVDTFHMTKRYRKYLYESCHGRDIKYVSEQEELSWDTVNNSYQSYVKKNDKIKRNKKDRN